MRELRWRINEIERRNYEASRLEASFHQVELPAFDEFGSDESGSELTAEQEEAMNNALAQAKLRKQTEHATNGKRK